MADDELRVSSGGNGRVIQWHKDGMIIDTWPMHIDPGPSDALARRMAQELINRPWLTVVPYPGEPSAVEEQIMDVLEAVWANGRDQTIYTSTDTPSPREALKQIMKIVRGEDG